MKKLSIVSIILITVFYFGPIQNITAQRNIAPPLLIQQNQMPIALPAGPGIPPTPLGNLPLPSRQTGIPITHLIPTQTLLANLQQAITTSKKLNKSLSAGKVWFMRSPAGEIEIKGSVLYQGVVVATLHFNPLNGKILPTGINPQAFQNTADISLVKSNLSTVINRLKVLSAAEFMEPEACWSFPVAMGTIIVAHIKVYYDGIHVIPDYLANQEMAFYGQ